MTNGTIPLLTAPFADEDDFIDVPTLNERASRHVLSRVEVVRETRGEATTTACVVLGPAGAGKTHLFARLRRHSGSVARAGATFLLFRPYFGVSLSLRDVLAQIVDQLCRQRTAELSQLDLVVVPWLAGDDTKTFPSAILESVRSLAPDARDEHLDQATTRVIEALPSLAPAARLVRALLGVSSLPRPEAWAELAWLSGREPRHEMDQDVLGEPDVVHMLRILALLAARTAPLVLVFDQLENLASENDQRVLAYGTLIAELVDTVPCLTIVQLALTSEWIEFIEPRLSLPQKSRVSGETFVLEGPSRDQREQLLRAWYERLAPRGPKGGAQRFPRPLTSEQLEGLLSAPGMTPRLLLAALARGLSGRASQGDSLLDPRLEPRDPGQNAPSSRVTSKSPLQGLLAEESSKLAAEVAERARASTTVTEAELAEAVGTALSFVANVDVTSQTERGRVSTLVRSPGHALTIVYLASTHHASCAATLSRAIALANDGKVVIVRERAFELPKTWQIVHERRAAFECLPNARWLWLEQTDLVDCMAAARILSQARAKRARSEDGEVLEIDRAREELGAALRFSARDPAAAVVRWLVDVPRAAPPEPPHADPAPPPDTPASDAPEELRVLVRDWMRLGRKVGEAAFARALARLGRRP